MREGRNLTTIYGTNLMRRVNLFALLPLLVALAYWIRVESVIILVSLVFPLMLAIQGVLGRSVSTTTPTHRDTLTGLDDRHAALEKMSAFLIDPAFSGRETAILVVDLDSFRKINRRFDMDTGDRLLVEVGERLRSCVRDSDVVARIDGDEFAIILHPMQSGDIGIALSIAERIKAAIDRPFAVDHTTCHLCCSIGLCSATRAPRRTAASMLGSAEIALELAINEGPGAIRCFSPGMARRMQRLRHLSSQLGEALDTGQIRPWFQPQICTDTGEVAGFEALARWEHPENGIILPALFLDAIESTGQSERLGQIILHHSLIALREWDRAGFRVPGVGINFSSTELQNPKLVERIKWEVDRLDIHPSRITIEILENVVSDHEDDIVSRNIRSLAAQGFNLDLDDFGTGHAAIANIRRFRVNRIKIDRSLVKGLDKDPEQQSLAGAIIRMAESLGVDALAEGVETVGEHHRLAQLGCRYVQGYGIARPMPFDDTVTWLGRHNEKLRRGNGPWRRAG